jgi:signal transduction histidine kinase
VVRNEKGEPAALIGIARDITERMKAEAELRAQKELIDRILTSTPNAVVVLNQDMQVILVNQTFTNVFHVKEGEVDGKPLSAIQGIRSLATPVKEVLAGGGTGENVQFHHRMAGVNRTFIADIIPMYEHEVLLIARDVTDERERTEKLYLTDRLVSVGEMAAGVAHEINNPLTTVVALSHLLVDSELPDDVRQDVLDIHNEAQRAADVVRNLLLFARGEGAEKQPEQINDLIEEVIRLRTYKNKIDNIRIDTRLGANLPDVMVDRSEMRQVFLNIVLNAEQAMLKAHGRGLLTITSQRVNGDVRISFADDGPGIDKHVRKRAFDPFFTTKQVGEGTGLGLSISYGIVTAHGGHIRAKSAPGQGATVTVELPAAGNELEKRKISSIDEASADDVIRRNGVKTA